MVGKMKTPLKLLILILLMVLILVGICIGVGLNLYFGDETPVAILIMVCSVFLACFIKLGSLVGLNLAESIGLLWIISLVICGIFFYKIGYKGGKDSQTNPFKS